MVLFFCGRASLFDWCGHILRCSKILSFARIQRSDQTAPPRPHTRMTTRFLIVWLLLLPLAMSGEVAEHPWNLQ